MKVAIDKGPSGRIRGLADLVADMNREDVLKAISEFNLNTMGVYGFVDSTDYDLIYEGRRFPPKAIFGSATERVVGRALTSDEFTGGESSACFQILRKLGFLIVSKDVFMFLAYHLALWIKIRNFCRRVYTQQTSIMSQGNLIKK